MKNTIKIFIVMLFINPFVAVSQNGWVKLNSPVDFNLTCITITDSGKYYLAGDFDTLLISKDKGVSWNKIQLPECFNIKDIKFFNSDTGYLLSNDRLLITKNGGVNWQRIPLEFHHFENRNLCFIDESTGYICGGNDSPNSFVTKTTNGGLNWSIQNFDVGDAVGIKFFDHLNGSFLICHKLYYTTDGGENWLSNSPIPICSFVKFSTDKTTHYIAGDSGTIFKTSDNGISWTKLRTGAYENINDIYFINESIGFAVGSNGLILKTIDGGENWYVQHSNTEKNLYSIKFVNEHTGLICGEDGIILKTTTGGDIISKIRNEYNANEFYLSQNYPNPFNPVTNINFALPVDSRVMLKIYDITGREITTLVNEFRSAGHHVASFDASDLSSGVYFYRIETENFSDIKKMILIK